MTYAYSAQQGSSALGDVHFRVSDAADNRIATCYLEENAQLVTDLLNKGASCNGEAGPTMNEFSALNLARCESPNGFNHQLSSWSLSDWFTAILGELGEAANIVKKLNRIRDGIPGNKESEAELREKLRREMADTFVYLDLAAQAAGFRLGDVVPKVFAAKSRQIGYRG